VLQWINVGTAQCENGSGGDVVAATDNEKCHYGTCVGCIAAPATATTVCPHANFAFQVASDNSVAICANVSNAGIVSGQQTVAFSEITLVGTPSFSPDLTQAFLNQFDGNYIVTVLPNRIELSCLADCPGGADIFIGVGGFCYIELNTADRKRSSANVIVGGTLLTPQVFT